MRVSVVFGCLHYLDAIEKASQMKNQYLNWLAILNYVSEELLIGPENIPTLMDTVAKIPNKTKDIEINV